MRIYTRIERKIGASTVAAVGLFCLFGLAVPIIWLGFCFIPCCLDSILN